MNRYLQQAKADLEKQIQLLEKYLTLRKLQLKTLTLAKTQEEKINTEELNLNTLEFYMIQEEKYIAKLQFYFKRQLEWEKSSHIKIMPYDYQTCEIKKSSLIKQLNQQTKKLEDLFSSIKELYNQSLRKIHANKLYRQDKSFFQGGPTFIDIQG